MKEAFEEISKAEVIYLTTGAGMSADSGIPTYRGTDGVWGKVEGEREGNIFEIMNPAYLQKEPLYMWQRFLRRIDFFEKTEPHEGYFILKSLAKHFGSRLFTITSNIDGQFSDAGFPDNALYEIHGNIHFMQCADKCTEHIFPFREKFPQGFSVQTGTDIPRCENCGALLRPNVYLFRDKGFLRGRVSAQKERFELFLNENKYKRSLIIEIGSGKHVQAIRAKSRRICRETGGRLIRINPEDAETKAPGISIHSGALKALKGINNLANTEFP